MKTRSAKQPPVPSVGAVLAALGGSLFSFVYLAEAYVTNSPVVQWDAEFNHWLHHEASPPLVKLLEIATVAGSTLFLFAVTCAAVGVLLLRRRHTDVALVLLAFAGMQLLSVVLKLAFERPRPPFHDSSLTLAGFSFPSGHASISLALFGALAIVFLRDRAGWKARVRPLFALTGVLALIGFSRIYLGAHYLSDVLAGFSIGLAWLMVSVLAIAIAERRRLDHSEPQAAAWVRRLNERYGYRPEPAEIVGRPDL